MTARRGGRGRFLRLGAFGVAVASTVGLTQVPVSGAFTGITGNTTNTATASSNFCTATPNTVTVPMTGDAWVDEEFPDDNHQDDRDLRVRTSGFDYQAWAGFDLASVPIPPHCQVAQATLKYWNKTPVSGQRVDVFRGASSWIATEIDYNNKPSRTGTAASSFTPSVAGYQTWDVTLHVRNQYTNGNYGFVLVAAGTTGPLQVYSDRVSPNPPSLELTWG